EALNGMQTTPVPAMKFVIGVSTGAKPPDRSIRKNTGAPVPMPVLMKSNVMLSARPGLKPLMSGATPDWKSAVPAAGPKPAGGGLLLGRHVASLVIVSTQPPVPECATSMYWLRRVFRGSGGPPPGLAGRVGALVASRGRGSTA